MSDTVHVVGGGSAPIKWELRMNNTYTMLFRVKLGDKSYWVGTPSTSDSRKARFKLIIREDGYIIGSNAVNFIATGGRGKADKITFVSVGRAIGTAFIEHVKRFYSEEQASAERADLAQDLAMFLGTGFIVDEGEIGEAELVTLGLLGIPYEITKLAETHGLCIIPCVDTLLENGLNQDFSTVCNGTWDAASDIIAISSGMTTGEVVTAQNEGYRLSRNSHLRKQA